MLGLCYGMQLHRAPRRRQRQSAPTGASTAAPALKVEGGRLFRGFAPGRGDPGLDEPRRPRRRRRRPASASPRRATTRPVAGVRAHDAAARSASSSIPRWRTPPRGGEILSNFLFEICGCAPDWTPGHFIETGGRPDPRAGRPDSAGHLRPLGRRGLARSPRRWCTARSATGSPASSWITACSGCTSASRSRPRSAGTWASTSGWWTRATRFLERLAGVTDPEEKRRRIGHTFIDVFEAEAQGGRQGRRLPGAGHALSRRDRVASRRGADRR